ncbi:PQQ-binding-like beta-propeller repeat protein [Streptomyces sp. W16]|uniref:caspase, EACC1-associated type n=1 Tax=Streptomyces sp. W16 TaxID=3076631 RepID=UPI00295BC19B|nr:PQQ-binding-like beta-propeller repeat protein [Streptomyces sp. W16]MDV9172448.1 PQQ-binding-like beta-propeller repeat protein [Streptomyces sp. W16]
MGRKLALLIANYTYEDEGLRRLTAPAHDAQALAEVLRDPDIAGFDDVTVLVDEPHYRISQVLGEFCKDRHHDDLILLYFTGHGLKDDEGELHLATADTRRDNLLVTSLHAGLIDRVMTACMSRRQVLILDCCYSGAFPAARLASKGDSDVRALDKFHGRGRTVLTASDATQYSFEGDRVNGSAPQSVFTRHLVQGLRDGGADLDGDGDITLDELYSYVHDRVVAELPQQRPKKQENVEGRIVIARNVNWALPTQIQLALSSPIAMARLGAVEPLAHLRRYGNATVRHRAEEELRRLTEDDSRSVSRAATTQLGDRPAVEAPAPPVPAPTPAPVKAVPAPAPTPAPATAVPPLTPTPSSAKAVPPPPAPGTRLWSFQTDHCVRSTPTVVDGVVYVGDDGGSLHAVDAATGERRWSRALDAGPVRSTPAVHGDLVYATAGRTLYATDKGTGQGRWDFAEGRVGVSTTVGVVADRLCVGNSGTLYMLNAEHGTEHWHFSVGMTTLQWVALDGPSAILGNKGNHVYALDAHARRKKWGTRVVNSPVSGPSALSDGTLYVGNQRGELHALDTSNGQRKWRHDTGSAIRSAPTVADGTVYVGNDDERLYALDAATGKVKWRFTAMGPVRTTPAVTGTTVHFGSDDGSVYAVDTVSGRERWRFPTGGPVVSSPAVVDGVLYVGSDDTRLHAIVAAD